ncbi:ultraviolet-B receptor UVR8 [Biomphalaria glabrata]
MPILSRCYWFYVDYISNFIIRIVSLIFPHVSLQDCSSPFKKTLPVVFAWGEQNSGALGLNGWEKKTICSPSQVFSLDGKEIQSISSGKGHTLVCLKDGKILSCGSNDFRQCGQDTNLNQLTLGEAGEGLQHHHVIQVAAGASHSVVLTQNHKVLTWGKNTEGQLGRGDVEESSRATPT